MPFAMVDKTCFVVAAVANHNGRLFRAFVNLSRSTARASTPTESRELLNHGHAHTFVVSSKVFLGGGAADIVVRQHGTTTSIGAETRDLKVGLFDAGSNVFL